MRNVAGLSTSEAQKSSDMFGKCRYLDEITGGRGVVFATGTPVSNSMSELYTVMRYLQYGTLQQKGLTHFDCWASTFGETTTAIELAPEGTGYRARTRFAKFFNLPELMSMFKEVADIKTSDQLHLPVPDAKFETVVAKPSEIQKEMVQELSRRAAKIHSGTVDASEDNMLCVTNDGRKIGLDVRLMNPILPDDPNSKLNTCVRNVLQIWADGKEQKLTQLLFCDLSTPKNDGNFNVYDDIRKKLVAAGVPESEVEFIHNADTHYMDQQCSISVSMSCWTPFLLLYFLRHQGTKIHYFRPPYLQPCYPEMNHLEFPVAKRIADEELSLPCNSSLNDEDIIRVSKLINQFFV